MKNNAKACSHGNTGSCPHCSLVKMVAYTHKDDKIVWYSFFKEDKKYKRSEVIAVQMGTRLEKKFPKDIKKMLFYENTGSKELIAEN